MAFDIGTFFADPPPEALFHYTTVGGAKGILESGEIWASDNRYLNDTSEVVHALKLIGAEAARRKQLCSGDESAMLDEFDSWIRSWNKRWREAFVVSFTEKGNLLSQWRGYAGDSGLSLRFKSSKLKALAGSQGYRIAKCIYDEAQHLQAAIAIVDDLLERFQSFGLVRPPEAGNGWSRFFDLFEAGEADMLQVASLLKHPAFREEEEWRLLSPSRCAWEEAGSHVRASKSFLIPYESFKLTDEDGRITAIDGAMVGPSSNPELAFGGFWRLMSKHLSGSFQLEHSHVPLRAG